MDPAEFAQIGADLVRLGSRLKELKEQRTELDREIASIEQELRPLVVKHSQMVADLVGVQAPQASPPSGPHVPPPTVGDTKQLLEQVKRQVLKYLQDAEPGTSAYDISQALKLDPSLVRQAMAELARAAH